MLFIGVATVLTLITVKGWWPYLWREWITSVDHKRIGVMYCTLALVMLLRGFADALMMRSHQVLAAGAGHGFLPPDHYDQIFSAHGTIMIFFMAMPFMIGLMNFAGAAAAGRARRGLPGAELGGLLADRHRRAPDEHEPGDRRVRAHRLDRLPAPVGAGVLARRGRRLLSVGAADFGAWHAAGRHQPRHHHPEDARAGHDLSADADVLLDLAGRQPIDRGRLPRS